MSLARAQVAVDAAEEMKALDVVLLGVRERTALADYLVICSGTSDTHLKSIAEKIHQAMREHWGDRVKQQGDTESLWLVLDYGDVIVHIFDEETREFYDLERLWQNPMPRAE